MVSLAYPVLSFPLLMGNICRKHPKPNFNAISVHGVIAIVEGVKVLGGCGIFSLSCLIECSKRRNHRWSIFGEMVFKASGCGFLQKLGQLHRVIFLHDRKVR